MSFVSRFVLLLMSLIVVYSVLFHCIMDMEGRSFTSVTGLYWTLTVMSTLGFGDITFNSDLGKIFTVVVLLSGIFLFVLILPFTFIRFVYAPWLKAKSKTLIPHDLPSGTTGHVIVAGMDNIAMSLISRLRQFDIPYVLLVEDEKQALSLVNRGYSVVEGELDAHKTYENLRVDAAALVTTLYDDMKNTNITATVRGVSKNVPILSSVDHKNSQDILRLAGCTYTHNFEQMLGGAMAHRVFGVNVLPTTIGRFTHLRIAEASASHTAHVGKTLGQTDFLSRFGLNVVGIWRGKEYKNAMPDTVIEAEDMLLLAGTSEMLKAFARQLDGGVMKDRAPVLILGGAQAGQAAAQTLDEHGLPFRLVEKNSATLPKNICEDSRYIVGNAEDYDTLRKAGVDVADTVIITTRDDAMSIYLTIYCRKLRPDAQIISRATTERNVVSLYDAGANLVMSAATLAANIITNILAPGRELPLTEGLNLFRVKVPNALLGVSLHDSNVRGKTQCNVVAIRSGEVMSIPPNQNEPLKQGDEMLLIGTVEAERAFMAKYPS
jgi:Trk K+ transport system NAD-binding subunit